jgi:phosphatidylserine/phosphatidylglycerophosphate/cardiolipin synthase-like enzyme
VPIWRSSETSLVNLELVAEAERIGAELPVAVAQEIARSNNVRASLEELSPAGRREALLHLFRRWQPMPLDSFGIALLTGAIGGEVRRQEQSIELVWTGPDSNVIPVRQTEQVLLDLIRGARKSLLVVSYAVYRIPSIREALCESVSRRVRVRTVLDLMDPREIEGYNPLIAIGDRLVSGAEILYWPKDQRIPDDEGRRGKLHVKCVVADSAKMFVSSANLTEQAMRLNMELGIVIEGTRHPTDVEEHFAELASRGVLLRLFPRSNVTRPNST